MMVHSFININITNNHLSP